MITLLGQPVCSQAADADEDSIVETDPALNVMQTAVLKAELIAARHAAPAKTVLIAADTTVALDGQMLNKPRDAAEARRMLQAMRQRTHHVHTGYVIQDMQTGKRQTGVHTAVVTMRPYTDAEIDAYIATGDPLDKAGAYAIQHPQFRPVARLAGCFLSVMGLPLCDLIHALHHLQIPLAVDLTAVAAAHQAYPCPILPSLSPP